MVSFDEKDKFLMARQQMVRCQLKGRNIHDSRVLEAMEAVPREDFVSEKYTEQACDDNPLPIGLGQTISQPYIVALMTQELDINENCEVLEIGTGCGYQTAILATLAKKVYTIERLEQLSENAQAVLGKCGIETVEYYIGDGTKGWPNEKQFDRILVSAAAPEIPKPLISQLKPNGKIIIPVGGAAVQELVIATKTVQNKIETKSICGVRFVRLIGEYGYAND